MVLMQMASLEQSQSSRSRSHILIVDDDASVCAVLCDALEEIYAVTCVPTGEMALNVLQHDSVDVVLLSAALPGIHGLPIAAHIRAEAATQHLPIILITAKARSADAVRGLEQGANDYITKPIDIPLLLARVKTQITVRQALDERQQAIDMLMSVQQLRDRMFRTATHDLKNPLSNIRMVEFLLREVLPNTTVARQVMEVLQLSIDSMEQIIADFLDVVVLQSGTLTLKAAAVPLDIAICNQMILYEALATRKNIALKLGDLNGCVVADAARLAQVISNLVSNAIKYSPPDTTVTLWVDAVEDRLRINVADQGPGIPPTERHLLFTEFGKLTPRPTGQESSTGLGLWIVKSLVELMNGTVGAECPPDGGSIFWVELPMC